MVTSSLRGSYLFCERSSIQAVTSAHGVTELQFCRADFPYIARTKEDYVSVLLISVAKANLLLHPQTPLSTAKRPRTQGLFPQPLRGLAASLPSVSSRFSPVGLIPYCTKIKSWFELFLMF